MGSQDTLVASETIRNMCRTKSYGLFILPWRPLTLKTPWRPPDHEVGFSSCDPGIVDGVPNVNSGTPILTKIRIKIKKFGVATVVMGIYVIIRCL